TLRTALLFVIKAILILEPRCGFHTQDLHHLISRVRAVITHRKRTLGTLFKSLRAYGFVRSFVNLNPEPEHTMDALQALLHV
ncbi:MAG: hypothetical protein OEY31_01135, partial [Candidatus Bathyarchaeota archaeon]|nr:hypothetical protein [Candidatus Bathyarchaeota archaeon]